VIPIGDQISVIFGFGIAAGLVETISPPNPTTLNEEEERALTVPFRALSKLSKLLLRIQWVLRFLEGGLWIWAIFFSSVAFWKAILIGLIGLLIGMKIFGFILGIIFSLMFKMMGFNEENSEISFGTAAVSLVVPFFLTVLIGTYMVGMTFWIFSH
jgi:hypothetical protein